MDIQKTSLLRYTQRCRGQANTGLAAPLSGPRHNFLTMTNSGRTILGSSRERREISNEPADQPTGGARRDRTDDLKLAKLPLSQLSYGPDAADLVGLGGLEPPTSRLSSARSNQLSYKPDQRSVPEMRAHSMKKRNEDGDIPPIAI